MKLVVAGTGQGGSNIADEFARMGAWAWKDRGIRLFTGSQRDPVYTGIFAVNLGAGDMRGLKTIPQRENHAILIGTTDRFRGRGAGKVNTVGAEQARRNADKILGTIREHGDVYSADAILVIATTAGGTGSGSVGVVVDLLKDEFNKPTYAMLVLPFQHQYNDPDSIVNTATCLRRVLSNSKADGTILVDNQKFVRKSASMEMNYTLINQRIANTFLDLLCVGEETDPRHIGEVLDASDVIAVLHGPCAIGVSYGSVPKQFLLNRAWRRSSPRDLSASKEQVERAQNVVNTALAELSVDCAYREGGRTTYDARHVLGLFSGPAHETIEEIVEMMDDILAQQAPGAGRRKGTYPGRTSNTIGATILIGGLGEGAFMDKMQWFSEEATKMMNDTKNETQRREGRWEEIRKAGEQLPEL